ncbi:hypothetical protein ACFW35_08820 [Fictibacillus sp. NPDC058756]
MRLGLMNVLKEINQRNVVKINWRVTKSLKGIKEDYLKTIMINKTQNK